MLGKMKKLLPLREMAKNFGLVSKRRSPKRGPKPYVRPIIRGKEVKKIGGDTSYAGKENRDFCKEKNIQTSFVKRGRPSKTAKEKDFVRYFYFPHRQRGALGGATDRAATGKGGVAKCPEEFQNGVLMRELLNQCAEKCGNYVGMNK